MAEIIVENDDTNTIIIDGKEFSEQTVKAALKAYFIDEPEDKSKRKVLLEGSNGSEDDVYLEIVQDNDEVMINSVTKDSEWRKNICAFSINGLYLCSCADRAGFPVDDVDKCIKITSN